jgi:hypothetical protein
LPSSTVVALKKIYERRSDRLRSGRSNRRPTARLLGIDVKTQSGVKRRAD